MKLGALPSFCQPLLDKLKTLLAHTPDQLIINEYEPGQGISHHMDKTNFFKDGIVSLSLSSDCTMEFKNRTTKEIKLVRLERRSVVILTGESRYSWTHAIPARKTDKINGKSVPRTRRVSMTFRKIIE